jgi:parvulin-like peptidyl-prolyl isomerase
VRGVVAAGVLTAALLAAGCSSERSTTTSATATLDSSAAATVNGVGLPKSDFEADMKDYAANASFLATGQAGDGQTGTVSADFERKTLQADILFEVVRQEVAKRGLTTPSNDDPAVRAQTIARFDQSGSPDIFDAFSQRFQGRALSQTAALVALQNALGGGPVDAARIRATYDANPRRFGEICVRQIQLTTQADAQRVSTELQQGADFSTLVAKESEDPNGAATGGKLTSPDGACPRASQLDADFTAAALAAQPGVPTAPVHTSLGWHIILVDSVTPLPFDQVQGDVAAAAQQAVADKAAQALNQLLQAGAGGAITVNPAYGTWDPSGHQILPPGFTPQPRATSSASTTIAPGGP